jgi:hypothetical protein
MKVQLTLAAESAFPHKKFASCCYLSGALRTFATFYAYTKAMRDSAIKDEDGNEKRGVDLLDQVSYDELVSELSHCMDAVSGYISRYDQASLQNITICLDSLDRALEKFEVDSTKKISTFVRNLRVYIDTFPQRKFVGGYLVDLTGTFAESATSDIYMFEDLSVATTILQENFIPGLSKLYAIDASFIAGKSRSHEIKEDGVWFIEGTDIDNYLAC